MKNNQINNKYLEFITNRKKDGIYRENKNNIKIPIIDFTHNDYLGLSEHKEMIQTAIKYAKEFGVGSRSSRLLLNKNDIFKDLENIISEWKETQSAMFFSTGYQLNTTVLPSLLSEKVLGTKPIVFSDKLNHASIYNGILLSNATEIRYNNTDLDHLEWWLKKYNKIEHKFIVTESIFGMDGTICDIEKLINLSKKYNAFTYIDEAHASGVYGKNGSGLSSGFSKEIDCIVGTFSKGMGCQGGYVATSKNIYDYLFNNCSGFVYSTAPSPILVGLAIKSIELCKNLNKEREELIQNTQKFKKQFIKYQLTGDDKSHIFTIILKNIEDSNSFANDMLNKGILVSVIRYPTVPKNTNRVKFAFNLNINLEKIF